MGLNTDWRIEIHHGIDNEQASGLSNLIHSLSPPNRQRRSFAPEYYLWKLSQNPSGRGVVALAVNSKKKIVASTTGTYKTVWSNQQQRKACEFGDSYTDPNYQKQGIMTILVQKATEAVLQDGVDIIYTTPNNQSVKGYEARCSFKTKSNFPLFFWGLPISPIFLLSNKYPLFRVFSMFDKLYQKVLHLVGLLYKEVEIKPLYFDEAYDRLNKKMADIYPFLISREASYLQFRYSINPDFASYGLVESRDGTGELEAALIYKKCSQDGMKVLFVADMFGVKRGALSNVWAQAIKIGRDQGFHLVAYWGAKNWKMAKIFAPLFPIPVSIKHLLFYTSKSGMKIISEKNDILFSIGDTDNV